MRLVLDLQGYQSNGSRMRGIGRYSLSLALAMAKSAGRHDLFIALNDSVPDVIEPLRGKFQSLLPAENIVVWSSLNGTDALFPSSHWAIRSAELLFENAMAQLKPDYVYISSLFEGWSGNVVNSVGLTEQAYRSAVTLYDLIPLQCPDQYLKDPQLENWYRRRVEHLSRADIFLAISEFSRQEGIELLGLPSENIVNISGSCSEIFQPIQLDPTRLQSLYARYRITRPYVMYTGGFDSRKNIPALVRAFATLSPSLRESHQLVIAGYAPPDDLAELLELRHRAGLSEDECVITGYVPDEDLPALYSYCRVYAFPSLREGFGLPILEAMACGAVVISANRTSLPEVVGIPEATFDPEDVDSIAARITQALTDEGFRARLQMHARQQVKNFSWEECAQKAWSAFEDRHDRHSSLPAANSHGRGSSKLNLALIGGTNYLSAALSARYEIVGDTATCTKRIDRTAVYLNNAEDVCVAANILKKRDGIVLLITCENFEELCHDTIIRYASEPWLLDIIAEQGAYAAMTVASLDTNKIATALVAWIRHKSLGVFEADISSSTNAFDTDKATVLYYAIESAYLLKQRQDDLINALVEIDPNPPVNDPDWDHLARAVSENQRLLQISPKRLLVDLSELVVTDAKSGIQRVVRNITKSLLASTRHHYSVYPVYIDGDGVFRHANRAAWALLELFDFSENAIDDVVEWRANDLYLGLDLAADALGKHPNAFWRMKSHGVQMYFIVYDLIPLLRPDCVDEGALPVFHRWYRMIAPLADGLMCISQAVADELLNWLDQEKPVRHRALSIGHFPLGADLDGRKGVHQAILPSGLVGKRIVLMVGTLEPRKGHNQVLEAFEQLWLDGDTTAFAIVGKHGWMVESLAARIRNHPEIGARLFWFEGASDDELNLLYEKSDLLIAASEAEGFGLPLIEAAHHDLPILARDIPVFREVAGEHASYFSGYEPGALAASIQKWFLSNEAGNVPRSAAIGWVSWDESAHKLIDAIDQKRWYATYLKSQRHWISASDKRMDSESGVRYRGQIHSEGKVGLFMHGPCIPMEAGNYLLRIRGTITGRRYLRLKIVCEKAALSLTNVIVQDNQLGEDGLLVELPFCLEQGVEDLEVRAWSDEGQRITVESLEFSPLN